MNEKCIVHIKYIYTSRIKCVNQRSALSITTYKTRTHPQNVILCVIYKSNGDGYQNQCEGTETIQVKSRRRREKNIKIRCARER